MATILYKDGVPSKFEAHRVQLMLANGWSVTPEPEKSESDGEEEELRAKAKEAGIKGWHVKKLETLKKELG